MVFAISDTWWFVGFGATVLGLVIATIRWYIAFKTKKETTQVKKEARRIRKDIEHDAEPGRVAEGFKKLEQAGEE
jgi:hypothetical protein